MLDLQVKSFMISQVSPTSASQWSHHSYASCVDFTCDCHWSQVEVEGVTDVGGVQKRVEVFKVVFLRGINVKAVGMEWNVNRENGGWVYW